MSLTIEQRPGKLSRKFVPGCFVCLDSRTCSTNLTLTAGSKHKISFLCDDLTRLWINAEKTISTPLPLQCAPPGLWEFSPPCPVLVGSTGWFVNSMIRNAPGSEGEQGQARSTEQGGDTPTLRPAASVGTCIFQKQVASPVSMLTSPLSSLQSPSCEILVAFPNLPHAHAPCFHAHCSLVFCCMRPSLELKNFGFFHFLSL